MLRNGISVAVLSGVARHLLLLGPMQTQIEDISRTGTCQIINGILSTHVKCSSHTSAMVVWSQYKLNARHHTSIADRLESNRAQIVSTNQHYLTELIQVLLCAKQKIALRGHREESSAVYKGNFLEILHLVASHEPIVQQRLA